MFRTAFKLLIQRSVICLSVLGIILSSCVKEPMIVSAEEYLASTSSLYYYKGGTDNKLVPQTYATVKEDGIYISFRKTNLESSYDHDFLSLYVDNTNLDRSDFDYQDYSTGKINHWAMYGRNISNFDFEHDNSFFNLTSIDKVNRTISGRFVVGSIDAHFEDLTYTDNFDANFIIHEAKFDIFDHSILTYYTGHYETNEVELLNTSQKSYRVRLRYNRVLQFNFANDENGTHNFTNADYLSYYSSSYGSSYSDPVEGYYTISDYVKNGHTYKKYTFSTKIYNNGQNIEVDNAEILIY